MSKKLQYPARHDDPKVLKILHSQKNPLGDRRVDKAADKVIRDQQAGKHPSHPEK